MLVPDMLVPVMLVPVMLVPDMLVPDMLVPVMLVPDPTATVCSLLQSAASNSEEGYNLPRQVKLQVAALLEAAAGAQGPAAAGECSALLRDCLYKRLNGQESLELDELGMTLVQGMAAAK
jgi:hypothetical protein